MEKMGKKILPEETPDIWMGIANFFRQSKDYGFIRNTHNTICEYLGLNPEGDFPTSAKLIEKLNLTKRQATILQLRLKGYGYKAIATYIGTSTDNIKGQIKELRRKAKRIELTPEKYDYTPDSEKTPDPTPEKTPTAKRPTKKTPEKIIIPPVNIPVIPVHKDPDPVRIYAKRLYKPDGTFTFKYILHK
jgi:DNA-binding CsgD family transcriptional regulator